MSIDEARQQLSAYLDGELPAAERRAVDDALAASAELRAELDALRHTADLVHTMPRITAPAGFADRVAAAIAADGAAADAPAQAPAPAESTTPRGWLRTLRPVLVAAAACLVLGVAALLVTRGQAPRSAATAPPHDEASAAAERPETDKAAVREAEKLDAVGKLEAEEREEAPERAALKKAVPSRPAVAPAPARKPRTAMPRTQAMVRPAEGMAPAAPAKTKAQAGAVADAFDTERLTKAKDGARRRMAKAVGAGAHRAANHVVALGQSVQSQRDADLGADGDGLVASILRDGPSARAKSLAPRPTAPAPGGREARTQASRASGAFAGARQPRGRAGKEDAARAYRFGAAGGSERRVELSYANLRECLAVVQAALRDANVAFAIQPLGSGRFVVEAALPEAEAATLIVRLAQGAATRGDTLAKGGERQAPKVRTEPSRAKAPVRLVHLAVHFGPVRPASGRTPAAPDNQ